MGDVGQARRRARLARGLARVRSVTSLQHFGRSETPFASDVGRVPVLSDRSGEADMMVTGCVFGGTDPHTD